MKSIRDIFSSAVSELVLDEGQKGEAKKEEAAPVPEGKSEPGSLAEFDRIMGMLESANGETRAKGLSAMEKLGGNRLACVAIFSSNAEARKAALERLSDSPDLLCAIFSETRFRDASSGALKALEGKKTPGALAIVASNHPDRERRMKALKEISDADALLEVAYGSKFEDSRWEAIAILRGRKIDIGMDDLRHDDTLMVLADQLVKSTASEEEAVEDMEIILENVRYLEGAKKGDEFGGIIADNLSAYKRIMRSAATSSKHPKARLLSVKGLSGDMDMLSEIAQHSEYEDSARLAVEQIGASLSQADRMPLALVACMSKSAEQRSRAVSRLKDPQMLKHVCRFSEYPDSRGQAAAKLANLAEKIEDPETLRMVLAYARDEKGREAAEKRLSGLPHKAPGAVLQPLPKLEYAPEAREAEPERKAEPAPQQAPREPEPGGPNGGKGLIQLLKELIGI